MPAGPAPHRVRVRVPPSSVELARNLSGAARWLRQGGVVAFPTDTVTGLGCRADSPEAVATIFSLKGRDASKPLVLFVDDLDRVERITGILSKRVKTLLSLCWPGALTAVLPLASNLPEGLRGPGTVGVRVPAHPVPRSLVRLVGGPLATTSANRSGEPPCGAAEDAPALFGPQVFAMPGASGMCSSTVVDFTIWPPKVLRPGVLGEAVLMDLVELVETSGEFT